MNLGFRDMLAVQTTSLPSSAGCKPYENLISGSAQQMTHRCTRCIHADPLGTAQRALSAAKTLELVDVRLGPMLRSARNGHSPRLCLKPQSL